MQYLNIPNAETSNGPTGTGKRSLSARNARGYH